MSKSTIAHGFAGAAIAAFFGACFANASEYSGSACGEGFDEVAALVAHGWSLRNNSEPQGPGSWWQGDPGLFTALTGSPDSYASVGADSAAGTYPVVSDWLITPEIVFGPNEFSARSLTFYTRSLPGSANRLVIRLCMEDNSTDCSAPGPAAGDVGNFRTTLLDINPDLDPDGYPIAWTGYTRAPADGLPVTGHGRIAFHYYVFTQADTSHGTTIGIDGISMLGATACPFTDVVLASDFE